MSAANIQVGTGRGVDFTPTGGSVIEFPAFSWSAGRTPNVVDMHNSRDGILRKKTLRDFSGSCSGPYDTDVEVGIDIQDGATGVLKLYTDASKTRFYSLTAIITNVSFSSGGQMDAMTGGFDFALQSGTVTDPV